jgi:hypothetical protein
VTAFFVDKRHSLLTGFALELVAVGFLLCFLGQLRALIAETGGYHDWVGSALWVLWVAVASLWMVRLAGRVPAER